VIAEILVCAGCHGLAGEGRVEAGYPPLAGQPQPYLERQLEAFAEGRRESAFMGPIARQVDPAARARFAEHFSRQAPASRRSQASGGSARGRELAEVGDHALRVQACNNCHGPAGRGQAPSGPWLAGQDSAYLRAELLAWKEGRRRSDPSGAMAVIARQLTEDDITALAAHYAAARAGNSR
jgi:cytochrome c553